jgi:hypothetical protein
MDAVTNGNMFQGYNQHYYYFLIIQIENNIYVGAWITHLVPTTLN